MLRGWNIVACTLRHSIAGNLYARCVEIELISKLLRHNCTEITYDRNVHLSKGDIDNILRQVVEA